jgi:hypothetical protein
MWTIKYKNGFIHGYSHTEQCYAQYGNTVKLVKSLRSAKRLISRGTKQ